MFFCGSGIFIDMEFLLKWSFCGSAVFEEVSSFVIVKFWKLSFVCKSRFMRVLTALRVEFKFCYFALAVKQMQVNINQDKQLFFLNDNSF